MRDTLKLKEYFDQYIQKMSEGIQKFKNGLAEGKYQADKILFIKDYILQKKIGIIIAKYSKGDPLNDIKQEFDSTVELFCEAWDDSVYDSNIIYASLAYLLNLEADKLKSIKDKLQNADTYDSLLEFILTGNKDNFDEDREPFLKYLKGWYKGSKDSAWYGTHELENKFQYNGYWSFESATIAKRLCLDDSDLQNEQYYPYDLVHFN